MISRRFLSALVLLTTAVLLSLSCASADLFLMMVDSDATQTAIAQRTIEQGLRDFESTLDARQKTLEAQDATKRAEGKKQRAQQTVFAQQTVDASPPQITAITFPSSIPGDKSHQFGSVSFSDPGGDVTYIYFDVVAAQKFFSFNYEAYPELINGNTTRGQIRFFLWCEGAQSVTLDVYMRDRGGHKSNVVPLSFECK